MKSDTIQLEILLITGTSFISALQQGLEPGTGKSPGVHDLFPSLQVSDLGARITKYCCGHL